MEKNKYILKYLPRSKKDLNEIVDYIVYNLENPRSAIKLIDDIEKAILNRLKCPLSFQPFESKMKRDYPYYRIYVRNFVVYYVVIENVMEIRRILYRGRNTEGML